MSNQGPPNNKNSNIHAINQAKQFSNQAKPQNNRQKEPRHDRTHTLIKELY